MVPRIHAGGKSFGGIVEYLTHDAAIPGDRHPTTGARVGWVEVENLPDCQPRTVAAVMRATARDAAVLKELAGVSAKGRALTKPVYHYSLSWAKDERPTRDDMLTAARESLKTLGMRDRQALIVQHTDRAHRHCHIVVNRVSPEDGRAASRTHDARALSTWARTWERERGGVRCHGRRWPLREVVVEVATRVFTGGEPPFNPPPQPRRGPGRPGRDRQDRQEWTALYARQRLDAKDQASGRQLEKISSDPHHRIERRELAQEQRATRDQERVDASRRRLPTYEPDNNAWKQWNGIQRDNMGARAVEPRLPHVGGVLAVSDSTFAQLRDHFIWVKKCAMAAIHLDHLAKNDNEQRHQAEHAYYASPHAIDAEQRRQGAAYRAGKTTHAPSWNEAAATLLGNIVERTVEVVERAFSELTQLYSSSALGARGFKNNSDPAYEPGCEQGYDRNELRERAKRSAEHHERLELERIRAERERAEREEDRDRDFGPSR